MNVSVQSMLTRLVEQKELKVSVGLEEWLSGVPDFLQDDLLGLLCQLENTLPDQTTSSPSCSDCERLKEYIDELENARIDLLHKIAKIVRCHL